MDSQTQSPQLEVERAKARLLQAAGEADPLACFRRRPWATLGGTAMMGLVLGRGCGSLFRLMPLLLQRTGHIASLLSSFFPAPEEKSTGQETNGPATTARDRRRWRPAPRPPL